MKIEKLFSRIIYLQFLIWFLLITKVVWFPNSLAPKDLSFAIKRYSEELAPEISMSLIILFFIVFLLNLYSLFKLLKFNNFWRQVYLFTSILNILLGFVQNYSYSDSLEIFLDNLVIICSTVLLTISYLPPLNKKFK
jgi:hypothetical protein